MSTVRTQVDCLYQWIMQIRRDETNMWNTDPLFAKWANMNLGQDRAFNTYASVFDDKVVPRASLYTAKNKDEFVEKVRGGMEKNRPDWEWKTFKLFIEYFAGKLTF